MSLGNDKKVYSIILDKDIKEKIDGIAKNQGRSSSNLINHILKKYAKIYYGDLNEKPGEGLDEQISQIRSELVEMVESGSEDSQRILELSQKLDKLILKYYKD